MKRSSSLLMAVILVLSATQLADASLWGFYAHKKINRLAIFTLPPEMIGFYKQNATYIADAAINPDKRRFSVPDEAARHYIDLDHFGDSAIFEMPRYWQDAVVQYGEDSLKTYGVLPWHINVMYYRLKEAFANGDPKKVLKFSAEIGHYIGDAHVPLHTTENYNGQLTGQEGIHAFWESRLPELFSDGYNFFVGRASYLKHPQLAAWDAIATSHLAVQRVLEKERALHLKYGEQKYSLETKGQQTQKVYSYEFSREYHELLEGMVEKQMQGAIKMIGDFWYTAWVDAGQPDMKGWIDYKPGKDQSKQRKTEVQSLKAGSVKSRQHEVEPGAE